jgi:predicted secreted protein
MWRSRNSISITITILTYKIILILLPTKQFIVQGQTMRLRTDAAVGLWRDTAAITSIEYYLNSGSLVQQAQPSHSTASKGSIMATHILIIAANSRLSAGAADITFTSIPATYTDLVIYKVHLEVLVLVASIIVRYTMAFNL